MNTRRFATKNTTNTDKNGVLILLLCLTLALSITIAIFSINAKASTKLNKPLTKYYTSIEIESNDNLWDIETKYNNGFESKDSYIKNIKQLNNLNSDKIFDGHSLIVYYYE
ncbi:LysM peptidoglycan-binding domain-containing protein [Lachnospira multipara]|uniref:LysM peptidoglycan-binding domain-containing protein n=1 Tax=Lachnospira multipara TaxID=28051 RepID=UPI0006847A62|nr:LysM peptidoglycan-binding domain-containing protein [Lachnospira multipara]